MPEVIYGLMLWIWLKKDSIGMFSREGLQGAMGKDVLYDTINREDLNWRNLHRLASARTIQPFRPYHGAAHDGTASTDIGLKLRRGLCAVGQ